MPVMPRPFKNKKANEIVFKLIGKPPVLDFKQSPQQKRLNKELMYQETSRVR